MSRAQELLDAATPLPWKVRVNGSDDDAEALIFTAEPLAGTSVPTLVAQPSRWRMKPDAALIVYAVNRLPDYEVAVDALERMVAISLAMTKPEAAYVAPVPDWYEGHKAAVAALARLREKVPA